MLFPYLIVGYLVLLLAGIVMCFVARGTKRRTYVKGTALLSIPLWLVMVLLIVLRFTIFREPPSLAELQRDFASKRADLETILRMSDSDASYGRIAPDFVYLTPEDAAAKAQLATQSVQGDTLPEKRWNLYREIFKRNGIKLGIQRNEAHDAFIMVNSVGILNRGHASGYLYCTPGEWSGDFRYEPCSLHQEKGEHPYTGGEEGYSFQRIDEHWYAYDQGPS